MFVVVGYLVGGLAKHIEKGGYDVKRFPAVAILPDSVQPAAGHLIFVERLRAMLHQSVWTHVIIGTDDQPAQRIHERVVPIASIARAEEVLNQALESLV